MRQCLNETEVVKPPRASLHKKQKIQTTIIYYVLDACDHCSYKNYPLYNVRMGSNPIPGNKAQSIYTYIYIYLYKDSARMPEWSKGVDLSRIVCKFSPLDRDGAPAEFFSLPEYLSSHGGLYVGDPDFAGG